MLKSLGYGRKGDAGATGQTGPQGPKGDTGAVGPAGAKGDTGSIGPTGPQGLKGDTGAQGPKGDTGAAGPTGATGPQGLKGDTGSAGSTGPQGPKGDTGATGPTGPTGPAGSNATATPLATVAPKPLASTAAVGTSSNAAREDHVHPFPSGRLELIGNVTVAETTLISLALGMKRMALTLTGVSASDRLTFAPTALATAGCEAVNVYASAANQVTVSYFVPALGIGASYSIPLAVYRIT